VSDVEALEFFVEFAPRCRNLAGVAACTVVIHRFGASRAMPVNCTQFLIDCPCNDFVHLFVPLFSLGYVPFPALMLSLNSTVNDIKCISDYSSIFCRISV